MNRKPFHHFPRKSQLFHKKNAEQSVKNSKERIKNEASSDSFFDENSFQSKKSKSDLQITISSESEKKHKSHNSMVNHSKGIHNNYCVF
jgi:hypothetical protein